MKAITAIWILTVFTNLLTPLILEDEFSALFGLISELPVLVVTVWLFLKLAHLHLTTIDKLIETFGLREQHQREHHKMLVDSLLRFVEHGDKE